MRIPEYKREISSLNPVAIRVDNGQREVYAPDHTSEVANGWPDGRAKLNCQSEKCDAIYSLGYNRVNQPPVLSECIRRLRDYLDQDHKKGRDHNNEYVLE